MKYDLYYFNFNNYYNRRCIRHDFVEEYIDNYGLIRKLSDINFIEYDGLYSKQIINWSQYYSQPDYLIIVEQATNSIVSRWYVIKNTYLNGTQFEQVLKRDTIADNYYKLIDAPAFIEKATLDPSDPAIFNSENMTYNQIKTSEHLLKDSTGCAWLVGYVARDYNTKQDFSVSSYYDEEYSSIEASPYAEFDHHTYLEMSGTIFLKAKLENYTETVDIDIVNRKYDAVSISQNYAVIPMIANVIDNDDMYDFISQCNLRAVKLNYPNLTDTSRFIDPNDEAFIKASKDKIIKIQDDYYRVNVSILNNQNKIIGHGAGSETTIYFNRVLGWDDSAESNVYTYYKGETIRIDLFKIENSGENGKANIDFSLPRKKVIDQPFDMFCIPYEDYKIKIDTNVEIIDTSKNNNLSIAMGLASLSGVVYDLQLLPYCPLTNLPKGRVIELDASKSTDFARITINNNLIGVVLWCDRSSFTFNIDYQIKVSDPKITNETEMYRLCSPNYSGVYEFNPAKNMVKNNQIAINYFNVDCTYKPYQPYIHVNFDFRGLYGSDFNDARGLICGGDFSLASATDTWKSYEIQNKNYKASFDRQIESQEIQNKWSRISDGSNILTQSVIGGALGSLKGGPIAGIGATVGGINSGVNLIAKEALRRESLDLTKDSFGFNMQNIEATPNTLNKVGSFNANNKLFPFLEKYECTDVEKKALINKLKYNGMTVGRIGTIREFLKSEETYIKCKLIRVDGMNDFNELNDASNELNQGVFIK